MIPGLGRGPGEGIGYPLQYSWASLVVQIVKNPLAMQETWVWSLSGEDLLERGVSTHPSVLAWRTPWKMNPAGLKSMGMQRVGHNWVTFTHWLTQGMGESGLYKLSWEESRPTSLLAQMAAEVAWCWCWSCLAISKLWQNTSLSWQLSSVVWFCESFWITFESVSLVLWTIL